jgi:hypothetical protein
MNRLLVFFIGFAVFWGAVALPAYSQGTSSGQAFPVDPNNSALMLRKGKEAFSRARYGEAKEYFRKAIKTDPNSQEAWSYYDLAQLYTVAEQFKNHGRVVVSTAPAPEQTAELAAPAPPTPAVAPPATPGKEKAAPAKKDKPAPPVVKEKAAPAPEVKKPVEPAKPAVSAPAPPTPPAAPALTPAPAPKPTPAPGGQKAPKDEGC